MAEPSSTQIGSNRRAARRAQLVEVGPTAADGATSGDEAAPSDDGDGASTLRRTGTLRERLGMMPLCVSGPMSRPAAESATGCNGSTCGMRRPAASPLQLGSWLTWSTSALGEVVREPPDAGVMMVRP